MTQRDSSMNEVKHTREQFVICDLRPEWNWRPYVTFWRPDNAGYAYPLSWAGDYSEERVLTNRSYYTETKGGVLVRFPIARALAIELSVAPALGVIDGDAGPVICNTASLRQKLRQLAFAPALDLAGAA